MNFNLLDNLYNEHDPDVIVVKKFKNQTFWSIKDIASFFQISERKAWELIKTGEIRAVKVGKSWKVHYLSVVEYLKQNNSYNIEED